MRAGLSRSPALRTRIASLAAFLLLAAVAMPQRAAAGDLPPAERQVLLDLYRNTDGPNWSNHDGWDDPDGEDSYPCTWHGVICEQDWAHVQKLVLDSNNLVGTLPANLNELTGLIALSLRGNRLSGPLPQLTGLRKLEYLELSDNALTGSLPALDDLAAMESFHVSRNRLGGPLPRLDAMRHLQFFVIADNAFEGAVPALTALRELKEFSASSNRFTGPVPAIAGLPLLHDFFLSDNALDGTIGALDDLPELRYFRVDHNRLTGAIPDLRGVPNLQELAVAGNRLSDAVPAPPPRIAKASLCPNDLTHPGADATTDARWSKLTGSEPWWRDCR